jgi:peptide/nickel transport system ATP-binding protein
VAELGQSETLFEEPRHPYTRALLSSIPSMDPDHRTEAPPLAGDPPNPINPPSGCRFHTRCSQAQAVCSQRAPTLAADDHGHRVSCLMYEPGSGYGKDPMKAAA